MWYSREQFSWVRRASALAMFRDGPRPPVGHPALGSSVTGDVRMDRTGARRRPALAPLMRGTLRPPR